jgi:nucleoside-diphosphate-sugar epimerase
MTILVVGATGATGRLLAKELLDRGHRVKVIVRSPDKLSVDLRNHNRLSLIHATVLDLNDTEMAQHINGCEAVASCLGHVLNLKGIYGQPRRLVTDSVRQLCDAIKANKPEKPVKFVLMNTTGNSNRDLREQRSFGERFVIGLLRLLLPPQADNENAADYLRVEIGQHNHLIEWVAVRPDTLTNENTVTEYEVHPSPIRSALFNPGKTSRINVAHFMADLITDDHIWNIWKGQMPVIYNNVPT